MLTIGSAAEVLRRSRSSAYKLAEEFRVAGGASGLPHRELGVQLLIRRVDTAVIVGMDAPDRSAGQAGGQGGGDADLAVLDPLGVDAEEGVGR